MTEKTKNTQRARSNVYFETSVNFNEQFVFECFEDFYIYVEKCLQKHNLY